MNLLPERWGFSISAGLSSHLCPSTKSISHNLSNQQFPYAVQPSALPFPSKEWTL